MPKSSTRRVREILNKVLTLRKKYISERNFLFMVSGIVGIAAGLAAVGLKSAVHYIHHNFTAEAYDENFYQLLYPIAGLIITVILARILYSPLLGHAISDILYSITKKSSRMAPRKTYSSIVTSAFTVGFGGSAGLESPIILAGSAIGSNIANKLNLSYQTRTLMIGCGTAGVIAAIFNAPITGLIFSLEVILTRVTLASFIPLLISSVSATLVSIILLGDEILFSFRIEEAYSASDIPFYIGLGLICGFLSIVFSYIFHETEHAFEKIKNRILRAFVGGIILSVLIFICPPVYGEGYYSILALLVGQEEFLINRSVLFSQFGSGWLFLAFLIILLFVKAFASAVTIGAGGSGGTFAPSMFLGGITGFSFARLVNLSGMAEVSEGNFALVGMCGVLGGIQYAPLSAIFLIAELTGGYTLFIPLMVASAITHITVSYFNPDSPYVRFLIEKGELVKGSEDEKVLHQLKIDKLIETDLKPVQVDGLLEDLVTVISLSKRNLFPVLNADGGLVGIITLDHVREIMFDAQKRATVSIESLVHEPPDIVDIDEEMEEVMHKFEMTNAWNLPVVKDGKYVGFVSKSRIFNLYREQLIRQDIS